MSTTADGLWRWRPFKGTTVFRPCKGIRTSISLVGSSGTIRRESLHIRPSGHAFLMGDISQHGSCSYFLNTWRSVDL